jgi:ribonucleoside-triphosphate reductase
MTHLAPFVRDSYNFHLKKYQDRGLSEEQCLQFAKEDLAKEITDGVQTFQYQINSMTTTNGQAPFLSVCMYLGETEEYKNELAMIIEEILKQRTLGMKNEKGVYITPAFPKLLYVLEEDNIHRDSKYWYLTELAAKCTAKRMVPDYISEKVMKELKIDKNGNSNCYPCMGCRSFLTTYVNEEGKPQYYGRFNQGVVTINLVDAALSSEGDMEVFWDLMEERLELCHKALQVRHKRLSKVTSDVAPILWQYGALARLQKGESIHKLLHNGYSTISLGYAGLYECVKYMTGHSHTDNGVGKEFGLAVMQKLNDKCNEWKAVENIDYSVYGTPIESTTYKFAKCLRERFGVIEGITDRDYITNSYHVPVFEEIDAFTKLALESEFQKLSPGGAISYVETPNLTGNIEAVLQIIQFIYDNIMYAELNTKSDYCQVCGYDGEILIDDNMEWYCPNCGNRDHDKLNVARRTCGYIGSNFWNKGRTQEIKNRVLHVDNKAL